MEKLIRKVIGFFVFIFLSGNETGLIELD
jgi:hypothetical protein